MRLSRLSLFLIALGGGLIGMVVAGADQKPPDGAGKPRPATAARAPAADSAGTKAEKDFDAAARQSAERFTAAYNRRDFKAVAAGFTAKSEFITEDGTTLRGREAIERHFAAAFPEARGARLELFVESTRLITSNVAVEEGLVKLTASPASNSRTNRYVALHVNQEGRWLVAWARDFSGDAIEPTSNHERLRPLEWLVGEWIEEGEDTLIATSFKWIANGNFLLQEFTIRFGEQPPTTGSMRIGWDPATQQIKSWTFDTEGGYSEALWTGYAARETVPGGRDDEKPMKWVLKSHGVTARGRKFSGTSVLRQIDAATLSWESRDRVEGGTLVPDRGPLVVKRRPPPPGR